MGRYSKEEILAVIEKLIKSKETYQKDKDPSPEVFSEGFMAIEKLDRIKTLLLSEIFANFETYDDAKEFLASDNFEEKDYCELAMKHIASFHHKFNGEYKELDELMKDVDRGVGSRYDQFNEFMEFVKDKPALKERYMKPLIDGLKTAYSRSLAFKEIDDIEIYLDLASKHRPISQMDFDHALLDNFAISRERDAKPYEEKIDKLLESEELDEKTINSLKQAKEITRVATNATTTLMIGYAEGLGDRTTRAQLHQDIEYIKQNFPNGDKVKLTRQTYTLEDQPIEVQQQFVEHIFSQTYELSEDVSNDIVEVFAFVNEYDKNNDMALLKDARKKVGEAIDKKDFAEINKAVENYNQIDKQFENAFNKLSSHGPDNRFAINMSMAREAGRPEKYRNDIKGSTFFRLCESFNQVAKKRNIDIANFYKDPIHAAREVYIRNITETTIPKFFKEHSLSESIAFLTGKKHQSLLQEALAESGDLINVGHGLNLASNMLNKDVSSKFASASTLLFDTIGKDSIINFSEYFSSNIEIKVARMMCVEPQDLNLYALDTKRRINPENLQAYPEFSIKDYVEQGKTTPEAIINRMIEIGNDYSEERFYKNACKVDAREILNVRGMAFEPQTKFILNKINEKGIGEVSKADLSIFKTLQLAKQAGNEKDICANLLELKEEYNSRSLFWRIFGKDTARLRNNINQITETVKQSIGEAKMDKLFDEIRIEKDLNDIEPTNDKEIVSDIVEPVNLDNEFEREEPNKEAELEVKEVQPEQHLEP